MIVIKLPIKPRTMQNEDYWKEKARGVIDEFGNPFRIIKLRWIPSRTNLCTNFQKTLGFDDAILERSSNNTIKVRYRPGGLMWMRPAGGIGDFEADCPMTPRNIKALISHYPNNRWHIVDDDVRTTVKRGWEERWDRMDSATKEFNERWFKAMHMLASDRDQPLALEGAGLEQKKRALEQESRDIDKKKQEVEQKEASAQKVLDEAKEKLSELHDAGVQPVGYSREYLGTVKNLFSMRKIAKEYGIKVDPKAKRDELIEHILAKQEGKVEVEEPVPVGLGD